MSFQWYRKLQLLSIDIVIGAMVLLHFYTKIYQVSIDWPIYVLLGFSIWAIYTVDHIKDAGRAKGILRTRYSFHLQNQKLLKWILIVGAMGCSGLLFLIPTSVFHSGLILVAFCGFYALFHQRLAMLGIKEVFVAIVYTSGILVAPVSLTGNYDPFHFVVLFFIALVNLLMFSWFERHEDESDGFESLATLLGGEMLNKILLVLISLALAIAIAGVSNFYVLYYIGSLVTYTVLIINPGWTRTNQRYRTIGDGIFMLPILFTLW